MHHFKGPGESCVHEPHKGDNNVTTQGRASAAGLAGSAEAGLSRPHSGNPLALAMQGAPCGHFPELLQEEAMYFNVSSFKDIFTASCLMKNVPTQP